MKSPFRPIMIFTQSGINKAFKRAVDALADRITELETEIDKLKKQKKQKDD